VEVVRQARLAQPGWARTPIRKRVAVRRVRDSITTHADELAEIISNNTALTRSRRLSASSGCTASWICSTPGRPCVGCRGWAGSCACSPGPSNN